MKMARVGALVGFVASAILIAAATAYLVVCGGRCGAPPVPMAAPPSGAASPSVPAAGGRDTLRIGWTAWADAEVVTLLAARLVRSHFGLEVERVMTDIGIQYQAVAAGELDIMLMGWLPVTHANYWRRVRDDVIDLGPIYTGRLGWAVPDYVPRDLLASIGDLRRPEVQRRLDRRIQGIDPGSGLMQASERAMDTYGLDGYRLVAASGAAMAGVLDRAVRRREWAVVTVWEPHWIFARYPVRFLADPKRVLGTGEAVHALARRGFRADFPADLSAFFTRLELPADDLAALMLAARARGAAAAVDDYVEGHPQRVRYWLTGALEEPAAAGR